MAIREKETEMAIVVDPSIVYQLSTTVAIELSKMSTEQQQKFNGEFEEKSRSLLLMIALSMVFPIQLFFLGKTGLGLVFILTCFGLGIWGIIEIFLTPKRVREYNLDVANKIISNINDTHIKNEGAEYEQRTKKIKKKWYILGVILILIIIGAAAGGKDDKGSSSSSTKSTDADALKSAPQDQQQFIMIVNEGADNYKNESKELKKSSIRRKRDQELYNILSKNRLRVQNWIGIIKNMGTTGDGNAFLAVRPIGSFNVRVQTWNNELSDIMAGSLIPINSKLFSKLAELEEDTAIMFSGRFVHDDETILSEQSLSEDGSATEPEFTFKFSDISKSN